jgi:RNA polymerase subunit RPABC4/transcription elongation factor Spt4
MKYCRLCGQELPEEARFCAACGTRQPELEKSNSQAGICVNCGKPAERDWKLCPFCGASLTGGSRTLAVPDAPKKVGLYAGGVYQGPLELLDALKWIAMYAKDGGNYRVVLGKDETLLDDSFQFQGKCVTVSLQGDGHERTVCGELRVYSGVIFTLEAGVILKGLAERCLSVVTVKNGGTFIMNGGSISGNSANYGGGVYVREGGNFTMNGGSISGNSARNNGGGVYVREGGIFFKPGTGGVIYGFNVLEGQANKAKTGAAVYYAKGRTYRNTIVRAETVIDTRIDYAAGGWE